MKVECAIIGGGPAGLSAALMLGRSRRTVIVVDHNRPRNAVTQYSHGFLTRDGIQPSQLRSLAHQEIVHYPSVTFIPDLITSVKPYVGGFQLQTGSGFQFEARKLILAAGLKETLPAIPNIESYYGKSLFSCPYCDGWELKDKPIVVIADTPNAFQRAKIIQQWSRDLLLCTNGMPLLSQEQLLVLHRRGIAVENRRISALIGIGGQLRGIQFENGQAYRRIGGFISPYWEQAAPFGEAMGCTMTAQGGIMTDELGRTSVAGVYAAGDTSMIAPSQAIIAAGEGSKAAIGVNIDLTNEDFV